MQASTQSRRAHYKWLLLGAALLMVILAGAGYVSLQLGKIGRYPLDRSAAALGITPQAQADSHRQLHPP